MVVCIWRPTNPFTFGDLALDEAFTDREEELGELVSDMRNGQNVLVYAPATVRQVLAGLRAAQEALRRKALVGYCDLMKTPTKERFAAALAKTIYADIASPVGHAFERAANLFRGLRVRPDDGGRSRPTDRFASASRAARRRTDIDDTIERLLELPAELAVERKRRVVLIFDEFQEVLTLDKHFPNLMRSVFQAQPEVGHVYLGSKRHVLERIFSDRNEPFWRSAKQLEIGMIPPLKFAPFIRARFEDAGRRISDEALTVCSPQPRSPVRDAGARLFRLGGCVVPATRRRSQPSSRRLERVIRSEDNHLAQIWESATPPQRLLMLALAEEPTPAPTPPPTTSATSSRPPRAPDRAGSLVTKEIVGRRRR